MSNLKISEMSEASEINDNDYIPIVQEGVNKKIKAEKIGGGGGTVSGDTLPIGSQIPYGNATAPMNWLNCNGQAVSRTEYAELFSVIGTSYGVGDGSTTFNLPDKRKRTSVGLDTSDTDFNYIGKKLGEKEHTLTTNELPSNIGTFQALSWGSGSVDPSTGMFSKATIINDRMANVGTDFGATQYSLSGGGQAHNNMQPSEVDNWIIKAKQSAGVVATVVDNLTSTSETDALSAKQGKILGERTADTEWIDLPLNTGWINHSNNYNSAQYRKIGKQVFIRGMIRRTSGTNEPALMPQGYRPLKNMYLTAESDDSPASIRVNASGTIETVNNTYTTGSWIDLGLISYFID